MRKIRQFFETRLVRFAMAVLPRFSRQWILILAKGLGTCGYFLAGKLRAVAWANLDIAYGRSLGPEEKRAIARQSFNTFALMTLDLFWFARDTGDRLRRYVHIDESIERYLRQAPVIGVTGHYGNWELLARRLAAHGLDHVAVAAPLANPDVDAIFNEMRESGGVDIIRKKGAIRGVLKALKEGRRVALLLDQNTKPDEGGVFVDFFKLPIPMSSAAAVLSERTGTPVVMLFCLAQADGMYHVYALPPLQDWGSDTREKTQTIARFFERETLKHPGQWLWMYKRWKYIAPGSSREGYPFYAKPTPD